MQITCNSVKIFPMYSNAEMSSKASVWGNENIFVWEIFFVWKWKDFSQKIARRGCKEYMETWKSQQTPTTRKSFVKRSKLTWNEKLCQTFLSKIEKYLEVLHAPVVHKLFSNLPSGCGVEVEIHQHQKKHLDVEIKRKLKRNPGN